MTADQKELCKRLFTGHYLRKTRNHNGNTMYKLFDAAGNPIQYYRVSTVEAIDNHEHLSLYKGDHKIKLTLNLANIRRLHGRRWLKKTYKKYQPKN